MSNLREHAKRELELAGLFDKDSDYGGALGKVVLDLIKVFSKQEHSGGSASATLFFFGKLARFENLQPITSNKEEWNEVKDLNKQEMK